MFSSLEALDAEDASNAAPVVRQGAFQPKAKPRVLKASSVAVRKPSSRPSVPPTTFTIQEADVHEADLTDSNLLSKDTSDPPKNKFSNFAGSVSAGPSEAVQIAEVAKDAKEISEEALVEIVKAEKEKKRGDNQPKEISDGQVVLSNTVKKTKQSMHAAICDGNVSPSASLSGANENGNAVEGAQKASISTSSKTSKKKKRTINECEAQDTAEKVSSDIVLANENGNALEGAQKALISTSSKTSKRKKKTSNECEAQDTAEKVSSDIVLASPSREAARRTRRKPTRFNDGADDDFIRATIDVSCEPLQENKRLGSSQSTVGDDIAENDLLICFVQEKKLEKSKIASLNATVVQPATDIGIRENGTGKSAHPAIEEGQRKFKRILPSRRRVERRAMNPANPDLDLKKMTMKDIIRLAEAKEKLVKNDNTKNTKDEKETRVTNETEKKDESSERSCFVPQVQFIDGRIVINEESLTVSAHPKDDIRTYKRVEETHSKLNYHSYMKRTPKMKWRKDETDLFYEALREFGTNFSMIQHLFPGRTRKQVLLKYKKEEKSCPLRISEAMRLKPCESSHFLEVMSSMNLLPSETSDMIEKDSCFDLFDTSCREEIGDGISVAVRTEECMENDGAKVEEPPTPWKDEERQDSNGGDPCEREASTSRKPEENQNQEDAPKSEEKPAESPVKALSPRKKKSLFSYQTVTLKS